MPKRIDKNQTEIVAALRQIGITVSITSNVGRGFPDLVAGGLAPCPHCLKKFHQNKLLEVKEGKNILTPDQAEFHQIWRGQIKIVRSVSEALNEFIT